MYAPGELGVLSVLFTMMYLNLAQCLANRRHSINADRRKENVREMGEEIRKENILPQESVASSRDHRMVGRL